MPTSISVGLNVPPSAVAVLRRLSQYTSAPSPVIYTFNPVSTYSSERAFVHLAVAEGPNHSPGCFPQAEAPCSTNLCIENGALGSSANREISCRSSFCRVPRRQSIDLSDHGLHHSNQRCTIPLPSRNITRAFARRL